MVAGSPCMCMRQTATGASAPATAFSAPGERRAETSLIIAAPAAIAARITAGLHVSALTGAPSAAIFSIRGTTRWISSRSGVGAAPGAVDVDDVCAVVDHFSGMVERGGRIEKAAAVGEGIGSDVEDAHDQGAVERKLVAATGQRRRANRGHCMQ